MPLDFPWPVVLALNIFGWPVIQYGLAWAFIRMPYRWFDTPPGQSPEHRGEFYQKAFRIRAWKDRLPDGATWLGGGFAKARLADTHPEYLTRFIAETRRGELCHWVAIACTPLFFIWNPCWADMIMIAYAVAANLPCILVQRYNRIRLNNLRLKCCGVPASPSSR